MNKQHLNRWMGPIVGLIIFAMSAFSIPARAQTNFSVNWSISAAEPIALGKVNDLVFDATAADDGVRITMENTNPFVSNPPAFGLWTGFTAVGSVTQHTGVTFTDAVSTTISGQLKLEKDGVVQYQAISKTFVVKPEVHGVIKVLQFHPIVANMIAQFSAVATSESGPKTWSAFVMNLDCQSGYTLHNYQVNVPTTSSQDVSGDFNAMMPPTPDHCVWTGSGMADNKLFELSPLAFDVLPLWQYTLQAPTNATAGTYISATIGVKFNGLSPLCHCGDQRLVPVFNDVAVEKLIMATDVVSQVSIGPLVAGPNHLKLVVQYRANGSDTWDAISASDTFTITGTPAIEPPVLTPRVYLAMLRAGPTTDLGTPPIAPKQHIESATYPAPNK